MKIKEIIEAVLNSGITAYKIGSDIGVDRSIISRLRNGDKKIDDLSVNTAQKLIDYYIKKEREIMYKGTVNFEGKEYFLTQDAYLDGDWESGISYIASAVDAEGNEYEIEWELNEDTENAYEKIEEQKEKGEEPDYYLIQDEENACDWDNPIDVRLI